MKEKRLKYIFYISSVALLFFMLLSGSDAGITCDEVLHYNQSVSVYNYYSTHGRDQTALNTPVTHLKYYGQSYDNLSTILIRWLKIDDIYRFRHIMSSLAGWLAIVVTSFFAAWLSGFRAGILVLILFVISPTFIGHSQNNLKDIPFALGYISSTFYTLKFMISGRKIYVWEVIILIVSIAFSISIRAGGVMLICYLFLFFFIYCLSEYLKNRKIDFAEINIKLLWVCFISTASWLLSTLLWPFALQRPVKNILESYHVMAHYPDTFRQIFEGKFEWSDFMPWYYLPKSMLITIPVIVLTGLVLFIIFSRGQIKYKKLLLYSFVIFTVLFPIIFAVYEESNLYSSWRQFLFLYPAIVLISATGIHQLFEYISSRYLKWGTVILLTVLSIHPLKFMLLNHKYDYLYYNQFVGGLKGAYSNYETDFYYVSQTEASEWLINYLRENKITGTVKVKATYPVQWMFRKYPEVESSYFRFEERSQCDWDYAIVANRYISPYKLKNDKWPPKNAIHTIYADKVPVCAVIERRTKDDYLGYLALKYNRNKDAIKFFSRALQADDTDEMIFYNFAAALYNDGQYIKADSALKRGLAINPDFEPILMYLGNIAKSHNYKDKAVMYYEKLIDVNRKYFDAYVGLSEILIDRDLMRARALLRTCLTMNPKYKPAIVVLADTYRKSDPDIARKYDELAGNIK
jgi:tetratricopeptide (TPR) repeat protein